MKYFLYRGFKVYLLSFEDVEAKDSTPWETHAQLMDDTSTKKIGICAGKDNDHSENAAINVAKKYIDDHFSELQKYL